MRGKLTAALATIALLAGTGCSSQDVPPAHKGRMFDKTGMLAFYAGGTGFDGPIIGPGTHYTGIYNEVRILDCSTRTFKEPMTSMAKDGVQFALDVYVTVSANCDSDKAVEVLLNKLAPVGKQDGQPTQAAAGAGQGTPDERDPTETDPDRAITSRQIYNTFIRPALGEAVRQAIASYDANDINSHREELFSRIKAKLDSDLKGDPQLVTIGGFNLSNFKLPDEMSAAAADRATQQVLRDKAIAALETIKSETEAAKTTVAKAEAEAEQEAAKIRIVGKALHENPEYYLRDVYFFSAEHGGNIVLPADPRVIMQMTPRKP